jgi:hypothetical protein
MGESKIIKALENCLKWDDESCRDCPYKNDGNCINRIELDALALIHSLKDKNEHLAAILAETQTEVAREIFEEIEKSVASKSPMKIKPIFKNDLGFDAGVTEGKQDALFEVLVLIADLKKKYVPDTNVGNITAAEAIAKLIFDNYTMSHDLKTAVKLIEGWQDEFGKLKDAKIIEGLQPIEAITSVHMLTLEKYKDTNAPTKVSSGEIVKDPEHRCLYCQEIIPQGRDVCGMCEVGMDTLKNYNKNNNQGG